VRAQVTAQVQKAQNWMAAEIAKIEAEIAVTQKENERRIVEAKTQRAALIAEQQGEVEAQMAEANAQVKSWVARSEQLRRKLEADVIAPAAASKQQLEAAAKAAASQVFAQGKAAADALAALAEAYAAAGERARDALLLQKLLPVFDQLTSTIKDIKIDRLTVIGQNVNGGDSRPFGASVIAANEQIKAVTGVDLVATAHGLKMPAAPTPTRAPKA
jgi:flotillin